MHECLSQVTLLGVRGVWQFCRLFLSPLHPFDGGGRKGRQNCHTWVGTLKTLAIRLHFC